MIASPLMSRKAINPKAIKVKTTFSLVLILAQNILLSVGVYAQPMTEADMTLGDFMLTGSNAISSIAARSNDREIHQLWIVSEFDSHAPIGRQFSVSLAFTTFDRTIGDYGLLSIDGKTQTGILKIAYISSTQGEPQNNSMPMSQAQIGLILIYRISETNSAGQTESFEVARPLSISEIQIEGISDEQFVLLTEKLAELSQKSPNGILSDGLRILKHDPEDSYAVIQGIDYLSSPVEATKRTLQILTIFNDLKILTSNISFRPMKDTIITPLNSRPDHFGNQLIASRKLHSQDWAGDTKRPFTKFAYDFLRPPNFNSLQSAEPPVQPILDACERLIIACVELIERDRQRKTQSGS